MPSMPPVFRANAVRNRQEADREVGQVRGSARARGYSVKWDKAAKGHRRNQPLCRYCEHGAWGDPPKVRAATLTDHLYPHQRFEGVFWITPLWVSCCKTCHDGPKQAVEHKGTAALDLLARRIGLPTLDEARAGPAPRRGGG